MAIIIKQEEMISIVDKIDIVAAMEYGFIQYSMGNSVVPPVGELLFDNPKRDVHIKYGYIKGDEFFCIKIAGGFYGNKELGISTSQGLMLLFSQKTGEVEAILLDNGFLTNIRTAAAGALSAKYFSPEKVNGIGILGTGIQGKLQLKYLQNITSCKNVWVWNRHMEGAQEYKKEFGNQFDIQIAESPAEVAANTNLILTTTPSSTPLLTANDIKPGTLITAIGSDTEEKQELQSSILSRASRVISDSIPQSKSRGEIYRAVKDGALDPSVVIELGSALQNASLRRTNHEEITVVDLTGVAVQDIMIAKKVYQEYLKELTRS